VKLSHISSKEIDEMNQEQREITLGDLRDEMLQLRAQQALGGSSSNSGAYKQTRRSIARLLTKMKQEKEE
jgi:ribosomal protein L29